MVSVVPRNVCWRSKLSRSLSTPLLCPWLGCHRALLPVMRVGTAVFVPVSVSLAFVRVCVVAAVHRTRCGAWTTIVDNGESTRLAVGLRTIHLRRCRCYLTTGLVCGVYHALLWSLASFVWDRFLPCMGILALSFLDVIVSGASVSSVRLNRLSCLLVPCVVVHPAMAVAGLPDLGCGTIRM